MLGYKLSLKVSRKQTLREQGITTAICPIALSVIRMVKLFGWEPQMKSKVEEKRDEELRLVLKAQVLGLATHMVKCAPLIGNSWLPTDPNVQPSYFVQFSTMVATFATYVRI